MPPLDQHLQLDQDLVDITLPAHFFTHDADVCTSDLSGRALAEQKTQRDPCTILSIFYRSFGFVNSNEEFTKIRRQKLSS